MLNRITSEKSIGKNRLSFENKDEETWTVGLRRWKKEKERWIECIKA